MTAQPTPVEHYLAETEVGDNPLVGRPLPERLRLGRVELDRYLPALGGPLPYMQRLRRIEDQTAAHEGALEDAWTALARDCRGDRGGFRRRWLRLAERWSFDEVNDLIARHNAYYPTETRLPMDPRSGDFVPVLGRSYVRRPLDRGWIVERFPPDLAAASNSVEDQRAASSRRRHSRSPSRQCGSSGAPGRSLLSTE